MFYEVSEEIFDKLPDAIFGVVAVRGIDNSQDIPAVQKLLEDNAAACQKYFEESGTRAKEDPVVVPYREAFRALGINPSRYSCAIEALMDRIAKGKGMPSINPIVDLGNAVSLKYKLPIGAHDIYSFVREDGSGRGCEDTGVEVRLATAKDTFVPFGAADDEFDNPEIGEAVYVSGHEVRTRRWTWRQSEKGKITEKTTAVLFPIDGFASVNKEAVEAAIKEFVELIANYYAKSGKSLTVETGMVDKDNRKFEF